MERFIVYKQHTEDEIKDVEGQIESFFAGKGVALEPNADIVQTCKKIGFTVFSLALPDGVDGVILVDKTRKIIGVSNQMQPRDARFVLAHELGHYVHESMKNKEEHLLFALKDRVFHGANKSDLEHKIDMFAAAILVPKDEFLADMKKRGIRKVKKLEEAENTDLSVVAELAERYDVDEALILRRIVEVSCYA